MALTHFLLFDRWDTFISSLNVYEAEHREEINGDDTLRIVTDQPLAKGDRIIWDDGGQWREHVCDEEVQTHDGGQRYEATLVNSFMWDFSLRHIRESEWESIDARTLAEYLIDLHPAWRLGAVGGSGESYFELSKQTAWSAFVELVETFRCEMVKTITVDKTGVISRTLSLPTQMGSRTAFRFDYGYGMYGVEKQVLDDPVLTACYGYGGTIEVEVEPEEDEEDPGTGGWPGGNWWDWMSGGITTYDEWTGPTEPGQSGGGTGSGNWPGGNWWEDSDWDDGEEDDGPETERVDLWCYVTNDSLLPIWGLHDGNGGYVHAEGMYSNTDLEDMDQLVYETTRYLNEHSAPNISYTTSIPFASLDGARLGDTVMVTDPTFNPELRLEARILAMERNALTRVVESATFGTVTSLIPDALARTLDQTKQAARRQARVNGLNDDVDTVRRQLQGLGSNTSRAMYQMSQTIQELKQRLEELGGNSGDTGEEEGEDENGA